jgi:hypothetical protein
VCRCRPPLSFVECHDTTLYDPAEWDSAPCHEATAASPAASAKPPRGANERRQLARALPAATSAAGQTIDSGTGRVIGRVAVDIAMAIWRMLAGQR